MKVYIYLHTHWDREWYFSAATSQTLLHNNIDYYLNQPFKLKDFYLDGQWSIVEDYLNYSTQKNKKNFLKEVKKNNWQLGPWYIQPDVFNVKLETLIRNLTIAQNLSKKYQISNEKIVYCPDTFGFGKNLITLFNYFKFQHFVFWRGLSHKFENNLFIWKNDFDQQIFSYCLQFGYFILGHFIPWRKLNNLEINDAAKIFWNDFSKSKEYINLKKESEKNQGIVLLGCGHDQAPFYVMLNKFFSIVNNIQSIDKFIITTQKHFLKNCDVKKLITYNQNLDYAQNSKIHRTIASSRVSLKLLYAKIENLLYYQLEPLQILIYSNWKNYDFKKTLPWQKELIKMSAHDALGGCTSDIVYLNNMLNLTNILDSIETEINWLMFILTFAKYKDNNDLDLYIFNPLLFEQKLNSSCVKYFTTKNKLNGHYNCEKFSIYVLDSKVNKEITDYCFINKILFCNHKCKPLKIDKFSLTQLIKSNWIECKESCPIFLDLEIEDDLGDTYDFDPNLKDGNIEYAKIQKIKSFQLENIKKHLLIYKYKEQKFILKIIENFDHFNIQLKTNNNLISKQISLIFKNLKINQIENILYEQNGANLKCVDDDLIDWKKYKFKEKPVNQFRTTSWIKYENQVIISFGTNQFCINQNKNLKIILYRSVNYLGKSNLNYRPGDASGLISKNIKTPLASYKNYEFCFHFDYFININENNYDLNTIMNVITHKPILFFPKSLDVESEKLNQFIIDSNFEITDNLSINVPKKFKEKFIASSWIKSKSKMQLSLHEYDKNEKPEIISMKI